MPMLSSTEIIRLLSLKPHPEGGYFCETFRDPRKMAKRAVSTAIYYLLTRGERAHWHRVDATEIWHYYAGAPLALELATAAGAVEYLTLGPDLVAGERPQATVPAHIRQAARCTDEWTLVSCTVAPGFEFAGFELAPADWTPGS
jgi:uncharacterized protein